MLLFAAIDRWFPARYFVVSGKKQRQYATRRNAFITAYLFRCVADKNRRVVLQYFKKHWYQRRQKFGILGCLEHLHLISQFVGNGNFEVDTYSPFRSSWAKAASATRYAYVPKFASPNLWAKTCRVVIVLLLVSLSVKNRAVCLGGLRLRSTTVGRLRGRLCKWKRN